ncbi:hypothetical protein VCSRO161_0751 [Vibrio cholerae]|nr:hypothetical protein VCSRO161_0751 [Vibrio cholerae]
MMCRVLRMCAMIFDFFFIYNSVTNNQETSLRRFAYKAGAFYTPRKN